MPEGIVANTPAGEQSPHGKPIAVLGCDPGVHGAIAFIRSDGELWIDDIPTAAVVKSDKKRRELDVYEFARIIDFANTHITITHAFIEQVGAMPTDGAIQAFAFGAVFGGIKGVLAAHFIPMTFVSPIKWRNALHIPRAEKKGDKSLIVARANEMFPARSHLWKAKCHADRAEAALIAEHGRRVLMGASL